MTCDRCDNCRALGYKFCIKCGQSFAEAAPVLEPRVERTSPIDKLVIPSMIVIAIATIICVAVIIIYAPTVVEAVKAWGLNIILYPFDIILVRLTGTELQIYWVIMATVLIAGAIMLFYDSRSIFKGGRTEDAKKFTDTPLFGLSLLLGSTMLIEVIVSLALTASGNPIEVPEGIVNLDLSQALLLFTEAAFWEEICFRLILFGVPMMVIAAIAGQKDFYKYPFGGFGVSRIGVIMMVITAIVFAYAHVDSWGLSKMVTVTIGGLVFGYLYMKYGIHVSMVGHMITDYSMVLMLAISDTFAALLLLGILGTGLICIFPLITNTVQGVKNLWTMPWIGKPVPVSAEEPLAQTFTDDVVEECYDDDLQEEPETIGLIERESVEDQEDSQEPKMD